MIYPGTVVAGKFRIARLIGEGAMGSVYEAEHVQLGRRVALKILHERFAASARAVGRFEREARAAAAIGHDNIVDVIDFGHHEGVPYIVMEYLRGQTLAERIAETTIDSTDACRIAAQVLSALASAHAVGIVHRDLKPGNVMLSERSGRVTAKILDFGISKFATADPSNRIATQAGMLLGTPTYMAPEQWLARTDVDHRADLFAVGVMLYEMLTGGLPYEGTTRHELFIEVVRSTTPPPAPSEIAPEAPRALDAIALRAVRREASERFQSAAEFVDALRPYGAADIVVTQEPAKVADADERTRSSNPPKRRALHVTQKDDDRELIEAILRRRPGRARVYIGAALLITGLAISSAVLVTAVRHGDFTAPPRHGHGEHEATTSGSTALSPTIPIAAPPMETRAATPSAAAGLASRDESAPESDSTPRNESRSPATSTTGDAPGSRARSTGRVTAASGAIHSVQGSGSSQSNQASSAHNGANPTPMPVSDEF